jgi:hypothetical protein
MLKKPFSGKRWLLACIVVAAVLALSTVLTLIAHKGQGSLIIKTVSDDAGGAIITWQAKDGIYAQRVNASGALLWGKGGVKAADVFCPDPYDNHYFGYSLAADGKGGAFLTWVEDYRTPEDYKDPATYEPMKVFTQRISPSGGLLWGDGVITGKAGRMVSSGLPQVAADGTGGCFYAWNDFQTVIRGLHDDYLRVQKLDAGGRALWGDNGILVTASAPYHTLTDAEKAQGFQGTYMRTRPTFEDHFYFTGAGESGAFIFWRVAQETVDTILYARFIDTDGKTAWTEDVLAGTGALQNIFSDGRGGVIFSCYQQDNGVLVQSLGADGTLRWGYEGIAGKTSLTYTESDGQGGAFLIINAYPDSGYSSQISPYIRPRITYYLQRADSGGNPRWAKNTELSLGLNQSNLELTLFADGKGGAFAVFREGLQSYMGGKLVCRKVAPDGMLLWPGTGVELFAGASLRYLSQPLGIEDGTGGVIIVTAAGKNPFRGDSVYAQRLDQDGNRLWGNGIRVDR